MRRRPTLQDSIYARYRRQKDHGHHQPKAEKNRHIAQGDHGREGLRAFVNVKTVTIREPGGAATGTPRATE